MEPILSSYSKESDDALRSAVVGDYDLTQAILLKHPDMSQDAGFELFDSRCLKRYWKNLVAEISGVTGDAALKWAVGITVTQLAQAIITRYSLPQTSLAAAVALAILLVRAAKSDKQPPKE